MPDEQLLIRTLVELADTLVDDFDLVDLLTLCADRCVETLDVSAAGLMLVAPEGDLRVVASSSEAARIVELFEIQGAEGPCVDCYRTGSPVFGENAAEVNRRWPRFARVAGDVGFQSVHAIPMRLRGKVVGALNLFRQDPGRLSPMDVLAAQALADVSTIAILQYEAGRHAQIVNDQLNNALNSRIMIEQAKGIVGERLGVDMEGSFTILRRYARSHNSRLVDVALDVINGAISSNALDAGRSASGPE
jgi:GAF domain-containing protein